MIDLIGAFDLQDYLTDHGFSGFSNSELANFKINFGDRMPEHSASSMIEKPSGFLIKAIVSVNAFDVAASGSSNSVEVVITPVADTPSPSVNLVDAQGSIISNKTINEDTSGILDFDVTSSDDDGSEIYFIEIANPSEGTISGGTAIAGDKIRFQANEFSSINFTPNTHFSGDVAINYEAFSSELFGSSVSDGVAGTFTITVAPVADTPSFQIGTPPSGLKNELFLLLIRRKKYF